MFNSLAGGVDGTSGQRENCGKRVESTARCGGSSVSSVERRAQRDATGLSSHQKLWST